MILQSTITPGCPVNPSLSLKIQLRLNRKAILARNISAKHQEKEIRSCKLQVTRGRDEGMAGRGERGEKEEQRRVSRPPSSQWSQNSALVGRPLVNSFGVIIINRAASDRSPVAIFPLPICNRSSGRRFNCRGDKVLASHKALSRVLTRTSSRRYTRE